MLILVDLVLTAHATVYLAIYTLHGTSS